MRICFTFPGDPVPASRPRVTRTHTYTPPRYSNYKKDLVRALQEAFRDEMPEIPSTLLPKERTKYFQENIFRLEIHIYTTTRKGDWDNFGKSVSDAIEQAGLIGNDSQVWDGHVIKHIDKHNPRLEFTLERIDHHA